MRRNKCHMKRSLLIEYHKPAEKSCLRERHQNLGGARSIIKTIRILLFCLGVRGLKRVLTIKIISGELSVLGNTKQFCVLYRWSCVLLVVKLRQREAHANFIALTPCMCSQVRLGTLRLSQSLRTRKRYSSIAHTLKQGLCPYPGDT